MPSVWRGGNRGAAGSGALGVGTTGGATRTGGILAGGFLTVAGGLLAGGTRTAWVCRTATFGADTELLELDEAGLRRGRKRRGRFDDFALPA